MPPWTQIELLTELEPVVGRELDRHLGLPGSGFPTSMCRGAMAIISTACWTAMRCAVLRTHHHLLAFDAGPSDYAHDLGCIARRSSARV
jgi:hypothetical protein